MGQGWRCVKTECVPMVEMCLGWMCTNGEVFQGWMCANGEVFQGWMCANGEVFQGWMCANGEVFQGLVCSSGGVHYILGKFDLLPISFLRYKQAVFPGKYGVPKPFYFPFLPSYWLGRPLRKKSASLFAPEVSIDR